MSKTPHVKSHYREVTNKYGQKIQVPVIDARDGIAERMMATAMSGTSNRSAYITYSEYHRSHKPKTQI